MAGLASERERRRAAFFPKADLRAPTPFALAPLEQKRALLEPHRPAVQVIAGPARVHPRQGTFHALWEIDGAAGKSAILRTSIPGDPETDYTLLLDAWASREMQRRGLPAVEIHATDLSRSAAPFDFQLAARAPGSPLSRYDDNEPAIQALLEAVGAALAELHAIPANGYGLLDPADPARGCAASWPDYLFARLEEHIAACRDIAAIDSTESDRIARLFLDSRPLFENLPVHLLHGDPGSHNIFTDGRRITAFLDWEDALAGDPVFDLASCATFHPERRWSALLRGYRRVHDPGPGFERRFWLYFLRLALAKTVHRHRFGYRDLPGRQPAARRIQVSLDRLTRPEASCAF